MSEPRLFLHEDGLILSIGFDDAPDTLLSLEFGAAKYDPGVDRDRGDMWQLREWAEAVNERLKQRDQALKERDQLLEGIEAHRKGCAAADGGDEDYDTYIDHLQDEAQRLYDLAASIQQGEQ